MKITVQQIADLLKGTVVGNPQQEITHPTKIEEGKEGGISFLANMKYEEHLYATNASAVILQKEFQPKQDVTTTLILVDEPYSAFVNVLNHFSQSLFQHKGVSELAFVHPEAQIADDVYIGPFCSIGKGAKINKGAYLQNNVSIGDFAVVGADTMIYANASIYHFCVIGERVIIHSNTVVGSDGFGFAPNPDGSYNKVPQVGNVVIGNDVEIGANAVIDRATMGSTIIKDGVKLDNLVQIAHNVIIDEHTVIAAQTGVAGSTKLGKRMVVGGQAGFVGHITIADGTKVNAQSGITKSVKEENTAISGTPAFAWREELKSQMLFRKLPEMEQRLRALEKQLKNKED